MSLAHQLAERISVLRYEDLPADAAYWSRVALIDTVGVTLAGAIEQAPRILEDVVEPGPGSSLILGSARRVSCLDAALINGTAAHVLDFDNATNTMFGHASATMIPALMAGAEAHGGSGRDLLVAHVAGFEAGARMGRGLNLHHYEKGWHPTSTLGVIAVAAACARLLQLTIEQTATALALSTSLAAGIKANFGTMTKPLHSGQCARGGLLAALLARKGFSASPDAFEHEQGFFNVFNGAGNYDAARIVAGWGDPYDIISPGACYKQYPSCASTHAAIDAALVLAREHGPFTPGTLARVESRTYAGRLMHTDRPLPASALDAKFSVQYCVARALVSGSVVLEHFEGDAHLDAAVLELLPRVRATPYDATFFPSGSHVGAEVKITFANGREISARLEKPLGRTAQNPIDLAQMRAKFRNCASRVLAPPAVAAALRMAESFEDVKSVRDFTAVLEPGVAT